MHSLRFRLPALFLLAILLAGLVSTAVAVRMSKGYAETTSRRQAFRELRKEATGLTSLYASEAGRPRLASSQLELATGDRIFYTGLDLFPGQKKAFTPLPRSFFDYAAVRRGATVQFPFTPPGARHPFLGVARPVKTRVKK